MGDLPDDVEDEMFNDFDEEKGDDDSLGGVPE